MSARTSCNAQGTHLAIPLRPLTLLLTILLLTSVRGFGAEPAAPEKPALKSAKSTAGLVAAASATSSTLKGADRPSSSALEQRWGIQVLSIRLTANGYLVDFRYRVTDPKKALPLLDRKAKPYLIDQASGQRLIVPSPPKIGPLRTANPPEAGRNYFILFSNRGGRIRPGSKVTVVVDKFRAENLVVK